MADMARILLVDDEIAIRSSLARVLEAQGHEVEEAEDGDHGLSLLEEGGFDLVITDINMPEKNGIEVLTHITELRPDVPVIAMSGGGLLDKSLLLGDAGALGAVATLEKPFEMEDLVGLVTEVLSDRG